MSNTVGVIFFRFENGKVTSSREAYTQGMSVPENVVGHKFLMSRTSMQPNGKATESAGTYYGAMTSIEDFLRTRPQFAGIDKANYKGVIVGNAPNEFIAIRQNDAVLATRPATI
jgi:hypothetical protein